MSIGATARLTGAPLGLAAAVFGLAAFAAAPIAGVAETTPAATASVFAPVSDTAVADGCAVLAVPADPPWILGDTFPCSAEQDDTTTEMIAQPRSARA